MSEKGNLFLAVPIWGIFLLLLFVVFGGVGIAFLQWRGTEMRKAEAMRLLFEQPRDVHHMEPVNVVFRRQLAEAKEKIEELERFEPNGQTVSDLRRRLIEIEHQLEIEEMRAISGKLPPDASAQMDQLQEKAKKLLKDTETFLRPYRASKPSNRGAGHGLETFEGKSREEVLKDAKRALRDGNEPDDP